MFTICSSLLPRTMAVRCTIESYLVRAAVRRRCRVSSSISVSMSFCLCLSFCVSLPPSPSFLSIVSRAAQILSLSTSRHFVLQEKMREAREGTRSERFINNPASHIIQFRIARTIDPRDLVEVSDNLALCRTMYCIIIVLVSLLYTKGQ